MSYRQLTALSIRFASLLMFIKLFEQINTYLVSIYLLFLRPYFDNAPILDGFNSVGKQYLFKELIVMVVIVTVSLYLFFKAEMLALKLIKQDTDINLGLSAEQLIRAILLSTGIIWMASCIMMLPDCIEFVLNYINSKNDPTFSFNSDFSLAYMIIKLFLAWLFVFRIDSICLYLNKKIQISEQSEEHKTL